MQWQLVENPSDGLGFHDLTLSVYLPAMKQRITVSRVSGDYGFEAVDDSGSRLTMDTSPDHGGTNFGVRPMQNLLISLGGCSGIDVVSILKKQRQDYSSLQIEITGEREQGALPALWVTAHMSFRFEGALEPAKAIHAATLSVEKYCSVAETLRRAGCAITWDLFINGEAVPQS